MTFSGHQAFGSTTALYLCNTSAFSPPQYVAWSTDTISSSNGVDALRIRRTYLLTTCAFIDICNKNLNCKNSSTTFHVFPPLTIPLDSCTSKTTSFPNRERVRLREPVSFWRENEIPSSFYEFLWKQRSGEGRFSKRWWSRLFGTTKVLSYHHSKQLCQVRRSQRLKWSFLGYILLLR